MDILKNNKEKAILAFLTFLLSWIVYMNTIAPTVSFWDCGEFIATSYTLGVPHPPGSPLYLLLGRVFSLLPIGNDIAYRVNLMSPLASALAVMFLFLIIVQQLMPCCIKGEMERFITSVGIMKRRILRL